MFCDEPLFDETYYFYDEGQSENHADLASAEDIFVSFMMHPNFQMYTGLTGLRGDQVRAIFGIAELALRESENQRRPLHRTAGIEDEATERVQRLCQALRSARRRVRSLARSLRVRAEESETATSPEAVALARAAKARRKPAQRPALQFATLPLPEKGHRVRRG